MRILILEDNADWRTEMLEHIADCLPKCGGLILQDVRLHDQRPQVSSDHGHDVFFEQVREHLHQPDSLAQLIQHARMEVEPGKNPDFNKSLRDNRSTITSRIASKSRLF